MPRFLTLADVAEQLSITPAAARTLVRTGELAGIQIGGKKLWRVEASELENYIERQYALTRARVANGELGSEAHLG